MQFNFGGYTFIFNLTSPLNNIRNLLFVQLFNFCRILVDSSDVKTQFHTFTSCLENL